MFERRGDTDTTGKLTEEAESISVGRLVHWSTGNGAETKGCIPPCLTVSYCIVYAKITAGVISGQKTSHPPQAISGQKTSHPPQVISGQKTSHQITRKNLNHRC